MNFLKALLVISGCMVPFIYSRGLVIVHSYPLNFYQLLPSLSLSSISLFLSPISLLLSLTLSLYLSLSFFPCLSFFVFSLSLFSLSTPTPFYPYLCVVTLTLNNVNFFLPLTPAEHGLKVLNMDALVQEAVDAYKGGEILEMPEALTVSTPP